MQTKWGNILRSWSLRGKPKFEIWPKLLASKILFHIFLLQNFHIDAYISTYRTHFIPQRWSRWFPGSNFVLNLQCIVEITTYNRPFDVIKNISYQLRCIYRFSTRLSCHIYIWCWQYFSSTLLSYQFRGDPNLICRC